MRKSAAAAITILSIVLLTSCPLTPLAITDTMSAPERLTAMGYRPAVGEIQITSSDLYDTMPTIGSYAGQDLVVFTRYALLPSGFFDQGDIWYQRLVDGAADRPPVQVTSGPTDDRLNDVSGDYIVYTAYDSASSSQGYIMLYRISSAALVSIGESVIIHGPRIHGNVVVWRQGSSGATEVMMYDLAWLGTGIQAQSLVGPIPNVQEAEIGDRFVVWAEDRQDRNFTDIKAYDLAGQTYLTITDTFAAHERRPATSGAWIVWDAELWSDSGEPPTSRWIEAYNADSGERRTIIDDGFWNSRPSIDGDLITYESDAAGDFDVYVYRLSTGQTFVVTVDQADQYLNNVHRDLVAYVDTRSGDQDIYVATLSWEPDPIRYVRPDGSDSATGGSWGDAFQTIQKAVDVAGDGDEIWVSEGTHSLTSQINVNKAVSIFGGFAGTETERDQRDWTNHVTTVDGQNSVYHCFYITADATLDGISITGGNANGTSGDQYGGGILSLSASPTIINCTLYSNSAVSGGALRVDGVDSALIANCTFYGNNATTSGGAIYIQGMVSSPLIINSTFFGNSADNGGGAIAISGVVFPAHHAIVFNSILWGNTAPNGGEIHESLGLPEPWAVADSDIDQDEYEGINGNIRQDPMFVDPGNGDFHLQAGSPCIDTGADGNPALPDTDFEGDVRRIDGDGDGSVTVDMGADEYQAGDDGDADGVPNAEEMGPNGNRPDYGGNNDGVADSLQGNVASLHTYDGQAYVSLMAPGEMMTSCRTAQSLNPGGRRRSLSPPWRLISSLGVIRTPSIYGQKAAYV